MTELSYPRLNQDVSLSQWGNLAKGFGTGILDEGGNPYFITSRDSVNNTITIGVDTLTGFNSAIIDGFIHFMDAPITLSIPGVTTDTTYEIGLRHDPNSTDASGTIKLTSWIAPADYSNGKNYIVLWRVFRKPDISITNTSVQEVRNRLSTLGVVTRVADLPNTEVGLTDSIAFVRETSAWYRLANNGTDPMSWVKITPDIPTWTGAATPGTIPYRSASDGGFLVVEPTHVYHPTTKNYVDNTVGTHLNEPGKLVRRWSGSGTFHVPDPVAGSDVANKQYIDGHKWDAADITSGTLNHSRVTGSTSGYNITTGTGSSVFFDGNSNFRRYTSTKRHKTNIHDWDKDPRELLAIVPQVYDRIDPQTGEITNTDEVGVIAEWGNEHAPEFTEWGPDTLDEDNNPETDTLIQGWSYVRWTTAHQHVLRWLAERADAQELEIEALKAENATLKADYDDLLARVSKLEGNA